MAPKNHELRVVCCTAFDRIARPARPSPYDAFKRAVLVTVTGWPSASSIANSKEYSSQSVSGVPSSMLRLKHASVVDYLVVGADHRSQNGVTRGACDYVV